MPVVSCQCGKRLNVKDELAGKQVRCPGCSELVSVPKEQSKNASVGTPQMITFSCACGAPLRVGYELVGKMIRCPKCSATNRVPDGVSKLFEVAGQPLPSPRQSEPAPKPTPAKPSTQKNQGAKNPPASRQAERPPKRRVAEDYDSTPWDDPYSNGPTLPPAQGSVSKPASRTTRATSKPTKSSGKIIWIIVGVLGGGFVLACVAVLIVIGSFINKIANFDSRVSEYAVSISSDGTLKTLTEAKAGFTTKIVHNEEPYGPPDDPTGSPFDLIKYQSPAGALSAYLTRNPGDGQKRPAIIWITGGDCNSIGDVWSESDPSDDQTASPFRMAGVVMMFPSLRGGNDNSGQREGFFGEVDDVIAAANHLAQQPHVDPSQIYLGGHSTGGTLVMLVAESTDRFKAVFSLGPVSLASDYGGEYVYCDPRDEKEIALRSPLPWLHCVKSPLYVFEGDDGGNWDTIKIMEKANTNPQIHFFNIPRHDHFTVISPLATHLAAQVAQSRVNVTKESLQGI